MALFGSFGPVISSVLGTAGSLGGAVGGLANIGSAIVSSLLPTPTSNPVVQPVAARAPKVVPPAGAGGFIGRAGRMGAIAAITAPILIKIAQFLGRRTMSLRSAINMIRKMGKFLEPAAIATALGITIGELATLITAHTNIPRRRMNPFNPGAARRALRRLESLHRHCSRIDVIRRGRSRSRRAGRACGPTTQVVRAG